MTRPELTHRLTAFPGRRRRHRAGVDENDVRSGRRVGNRPDVHAPETPRQKSGIRLIQTASQRYDCRRQAHIRLTPRNIPIS